MNIYQWIDHWAEHAPERPAVRFEGVALGYRAFRAAIDRVARRLVGPFGLRRGERIAYLGHNHPAVLTLAFACARTGLILVPLNSRLAAPEHAYMLRHCGASLLVSDAEFAVAAAALAEGQAGLRLALAEAVADHDTPLLDDGRPVMPPPGGYPVAAPGDPLFIYYTSGTTGEPKGAVLSQANVIGHAANSVAMHDLRQDDRVLTMLPLFHVGGMNVQTTPAFAAGATVTLLRRFTPDAFFAALAGERPTLAVIVPAQLRALTSHPAWESADFGSLRCITTGSTIVPLEFINTFHERQVPVVQVYGCTESCPVAVHNDIATARESAGSVGRPALLTRVRVVDAAGGDLPDGERGELLLAGPNVSAGYWSDPEASAAALRDGWFATGDIGYRGTDGNYYIVDRKHDLIISGSENIYPAELEAVLHGHPDILEAAVVGRPDRQWGEVPVAAVVRRPGSALDAAAVCALFEGRLGHFKHPRDVVFLPALPRNALGKVVKAALREQVLAAPRPTARGAPSAARSA
jgi:fatty-acyl-CoA synthase